MDRTNQIIPRVALGQRANPLFLPREVIHFQAELDLQLGEIPLGLADFFHILIQLAKTHPPIIKIVLLHRGMIREANFRQANLQRLRRILRRFAGSVAAKRRVDMVICWQSHAGKVNDPPPKRQWTKRRQAGNDGGDWWINGLMDGWIGSEQHARKIQSASTINLADFIAIGLIKTNVRNAKKHAEDVQKNRGNPFGSPHRVSARSCFNLPSRLVKASNFYVDFPDTNPSPRKGCIVYIDGFNWYFSIFQQRPAWKGLNVLSFFQELRLDENVISVKLFSAIVEPHIENSSKKIRQLTYFAALKTLPKVEIIQGTYQQRTVKCRASCQQEYLVAEEKKTDVNIAIHLIDDAYKNKTDSMVLVSGDSDLEPAITYVNRHFPKIKITVYIPSLPDEQKTRRIDFYRNLDVAWKFLPLELISRHQLKEEVRGKDGTIYKRPIEWR